MVMSMPMDEGAQFLSALLGAREALGTDTHDDLAKMYGVLCLLCMYEGFDPVNGLDWRKSAIEYGEHRIGSLTALVAVPNILGPNCYRVGGEHVIDWLRKVEGIGNDPQFQDAFAAASNFWGNPSVYQSHIDTAVSDLPSDRIVDIATASLASTVESDVGKELLKKIGINEYFLRDLSKLELEAGISWMVMNETSCDIPAFLAPVQKCND